MTIDNELTLTRVFDAPRATVFAMWADPTHLKRWCFPTGFTIPESTIDFRVGGEWRETLQTADGALYRSLSVFQEIVPDERIVFAQTWLDDAGAPGGKTTVTITLRDAGPGRTELTFRQTGFTSADSRDSHAQGWAETLDSLAAHLLAVDTTAA